MIIGTPRVPPYLWKWEDVKWLAFFVAIILSPWLVIAGVAALLWWLL